jgi:hypothetical protein
MMKQPEGMTLADAINAALNRSAEVQAHVDEVLALASSKKINEFLGKKPFPDNFGSKAIGLAVLAANCVSFMNANDGKLDELRGQMLVTGLNDFLKTTVGLTDKDIMEQIDVVDGVLNRPIQIVILG